MPSDLKYLAAYGVYALVVAGIAQVINRVVPEPYMDEVIHIPQAQAYCKGHYATWDPRLTTPPGL
jgi:alpha-1,2-glucosyltransferase